LISACADEHPRKWKITYAIIVTYEDRIVQRKVMCPSKQAISEV